jgi:hypothetical protein
VFFFYGVLPIASGFLYRYKWRKFRNWFNYLRLSPKLDYRQYRQLGSEEKNNLTNPEGSVFSFTGNIESITDGNTLWVRGDDLTIPVSLAKTKCFLLPTLETSLREHERESEPEAPEQIHWNRVSTLSEGIKVFIGGQIKMHDNRLVFIPSNTQPLMVVFYSCPDTELTGRIIRAARIRNEYWNNITPAFLVTGAILLISIAAFFLNRPAFRLTVINAFIAVFIPILAVLPPGFLFTVLYRRLTLIARKLRVDKDLVHFGLMPDKTGNPAKYYATRAYTLEIIAWIIMMLGVCINIAFIFLILFLFNIVSF